jgi:hypothetical protein
MHTSLRWTISANSTVSGEPSQEASILLSQPHEKFLLEPSRKFRFDKAWRSDKRSCGCQGKIAID